MPRHPLLRPLPIAIVALGFVLLALTDPTQAAETAPNSSARSLRSNSAK